MHVDIASPTQFKLTLDISKALINVSKVVQTDLGLPALGADWRSELSVVGSYDFHATFVLDVAQGFYVETDTDQIGLSLDIDMLGQATGKLGFFEIIATAEAQTPGQSAFYAEYTIDLKEPSGDDKLFLREIGTGPLIDTDTSGLTGEAALRFSVEAVVNEWLPSIETGLRIDWNFDGIGFSGSNPPEVTYEGMQLHLGRLLNEIFLPFFETIQTVFAPFSSTIEFLTDPLPVLKDLTDPAVSIHGLAQEFASSLPENSDIRRSIESLSAFIDTLVTINDIVSAIRTDSSSGLVLQLGDITFGGSRSPQFDARQDQLSKSVVNEANPRSDLRSQFGAAGGAPNVSNSLEVSTGALHLPIIEDPLSAIGWLLGVGEANLITWDLPNVKVSFPVDFTFPVFPGIVASMFGGLEIGTDLKVGLDTAGFSAYAESRDMADLFQGFYMSDRANADGTGDDVNELYIRGELFAGTGLGAEVLGVGVSLIVGGGVFAEVGLDLLDHDNDGKVRGRDLSSGDGCFALNGEVGVALEASAKAGIFKYDLPITEVTLFEGRKVIACPFYEPPPPAVLAGLDAATGTLTLFMGPEAHRRNVMPNVEEEDFTVFDNGLEIFVNAFGRSQSFNAHQVRNIVADGGTQDDRITLFGVSKPSILRGGDGDDVVIGGESTDFIDGGRGRDELHGGGDNDTLVGSLGDDLLYGDAGDDELFGQEGSDTLYGGDGADKIDTGIGRNKAYGDDGDDTILGGPLEDHLYGGNGNDTIEGGDGPDVILGEAGNDTLRGQGGDDTLDGGDDGDFLFGDDGNDRLLGRGGSDEIYGGTGLDYLNGGGGGDFLYGQADADELDGDAGDDVIRGGLGEDLIYGRSGADTIDGGNDRDLIYGGIDGDNISGGNGDDEIYGEEGNDIIAGGAGNDVIDGGNDSDTIYGFEMDLLADALPRGATDRDTLRGGRGFDRIAGGPDDDLIFGGQDADILVGNEGADTIEGNEGKDIIFGFHFVTNWSPVSGGSDLPNQLFGNQDDDEIHGGPEADLIRGQAGNDTLFGDAGADSIFGDDGNDTIEGGADVDTIDGGLGNDLIAGNEDADLLYGNHGIDVIAGNQGADFIAGNDDADFIYGDEGDDEVLGGSGSDTIRGGSGDDVLHGNEGDDLIIGFSGADIIDGDVGDDVIYGGTQIDTIRGGLGNDRIYGELGDDMLSGNEGDDVVEGGGGDDMIEGNAGNDSLYGDDGQDTISGGLGDDFLFAGSGITNLLNGDEGNDTLVGSDDGTDDPKPTDTTFFGDRLNGGDGDDVIDGLGGGDIIDGGTGNNIVRSGTHIGSLINGIETAPNTSLALPIGPERRGVWAELSRSANDGGLTEVGGLEQSLFATVDGVYVAWVDWRNGNSEIYIAYHSYGVGEWTPLAGFGGADSASGGGISNDANQSRRPTLYQSDSSDSLVVAWTSIAPDGKSTIEVAREDTNWARVTNPGQTGTADHAKFVPFGNHSGLLFWLDDALGTGSTRLSVAQYAHVAGCVSAFGLAGGVITLPAGTDVKSYDAAGVEFRAAVALAYGTASDQDIAIVANTARSVDESVLCPGVPNAKVQEYLIEDWHTLHTEIDGDTQNPDIGIQLLARQGVVGEERLATDIVAAWEISNERQNQVDGVVIQITLEGSVAPAAQLVPKYKGEPERTRSSHTVGDCRLRRQTSSGNVLCGYLRRLDG